jgi:hypothetical protein
VFHPGWILSHFFFLLVFVTSPAIFGYFLAINVQLNHFVDYLRALSLPFAQFTKTDIDTILFVV